ncbi:MAG: hypothetical protein JXQ72_12130 [Anaerolineae bacterium]|nr:hypothetical protein [Anaerolineae bacterium]
MNINRAGLVVVLIALLLLPQISLPAAAQGSDSCPANVMLALARAGAACQRMERGQACYGSGIIDATFQPGVSGNEFSAAGHNADVAVTRALRLDSSGPEPAWSVAVLQIQADLAETEQRSVVLLLFGDAEITNTAPYLPTLAITATATPYLRATPEIDGDILGRLTLRQTVTANGRTADNGWLRVLLPETGGPGWVSADVVTVDGDINTLAVVDAETPFAHPFQTFTLRTGTQDAWCDQAPESGLLVQSPNTFDPVTLEINGVTVRLAATAFIQAEPGGALAINVLDGEAEIMASDALQFAPAGARVTVPLSADLLPAGPPEAPTPYDLTQIRVLPLNNLPYRLSAPPPLSQAEIEETLTAHFAPTPTPIPPSEAGGPDACTRVTHRSADLRAGPGTSYEVVNSVTSGTRVYPVLRMEVEGMTWWQLRDGNWIQANVVSSADVCPEVPLTDQFAAPGYNDLILEICATSNGPLRPDQWVWIEFVPPAWPTLAEAQGAPQYDPGRITVNEWRIHVWASGPIKLGEEQYIVRFGGYWFAEPGTFRIIGQRMGYEIICNVTVPLGN